MYVRFGKRVCAIVVGLVALPFVLLIIAVLAPFIHFADKGPVFYNAPRVGKDGRDFKMYKLRSMRVNAPDLIMEDGSTYNGADDPRMTRVGAFMRKTSLDEMPQFLNVLKGDMSVVGPVSYTHLSSTASPRLSGSVAMPCWRRSWRDSMNRSWSSLGSCSSSSSSMPARPAASMTAKAR